MNNSMTELLGSSIASVFGDMAISEDEIAKAQKRHPEHAEVIWNQFKYLYRPAPLRNKAEELYRAHCREILERLGENQTAPTKAQVIGVLADISLTAPLQHDAAVLYYRLFVEVFGDEQVGEQSLRETYDGAADDVFDEIVRKLS